VIPRAYLAIAAPEVDALREAALQVARRNNLDEGYLRIVLTRGAGRWAFATWTSSARLRW
jgi:hypothetical protein